MLYYGIWESDNEFYYYSIGTLKVGVYSLSLHKVKSN
jgi:hypothetical protein